MPALSLLLTNYTMGSLPCGLGGYPHTPSHAGCRVSPCDAGWLRSVKWMVGWEVRNRGRKSKTEGYWVLKERRWNEEKVSAHRPVQGNPPGLIPQGAYLTHAWGQQRWNLIWIWISKFEESANLKTHTLGDKLGVKGEVGDLCLTFRCEM